MGSSRVVERMLKGRPHRPPVLRIIWRDGVAWILRNRAFQPSYPKDLERRSRMIIQNRRPAIPSIAGEWMCHVGYYR